MSNWKFLDKVRINRLQSQLYGSTPGDGFNGAFAFAINKIKVLVIASDGLDWQHVSVSMPDHPELTPSWQIMCQIKDLFWDDEEAVMQLHPPKSHYVNQHPGCLHLWRPTAPGVQIPLPNKLMVGFQEANKPQEKSKLDEPHETRGTQENETNG